MNLSGQRVLITGLRGQDGAILAARLLAAGAQVHGTGRASGGGSDWRLEELGIASHAQLRRHSIDMTDGPELEQLVRTLAPHMVFHLAGQSRVAESFRDPLGSMQANGLASMRVLEAVRDAAPQAHVVLAASAEIFDGAQPAPANEQSRWSPSSPYGLSKLMVHAAAQVWRASYDLHVSSAILFNHESPLRDPAFVTRKITQAAARIALGTEQAVALGNLDAQRDFGYAEEHVDAMLAMACQEHADDYVLATGRAASIRDFASSAFAAAGMELSWHGEGVDEVAVDAGGTERVRIDPRFFRPVDAAVLVGDAAKARNKLGFSPRLGLDGLTGLMVEADLARERRATG